MAPKQWIFDPNSDTVMRNMNYPCTMTVNLQANQNARF